MRLLAGTRLLLDAVYHATQAWFYVRWALTCCPSASNRAAALKRARSHGRAMRAALETWALCNAPISECHFKTQEARGAAEVHNLGEGGATPPPASVSLRERISRLLTGACDRTGGQAGSLIPQPAAGVKRVKRTYRDGSCESFLVKLTTPQGAVLSWREFATFNAGACAVKHVLVAFALPVMWLLGAVGMIGKNRAAGSQAVFDGGLFIDIFLVAVPIAAVAFWAGREHAKREGGEP